MTTSTNAVSTNIVRRYYFPIPLVIVLTMILGTFLGAGMVWFVVQLEAQAAYDRGLQDGHEQGALGLCQEKD
jgi:hypothetical protein